MIAKEKVFREYDIRGTVDEDFDAVFSQNLGRAYAAKVREETGLASPRIGIGRDCRLSGPSLYEALSRGLVEAGATVVDCGMGPTPQLYYAVHAQSLDGGIQVTGSHNPPDQNGYKMMIGKRTLSGADIVDLKERVFAEHQSSTAAAGKVEVFDAHTAYIAELIARSRPRMGSRTVKVVVDAGNGVGGMVGPEVLRALGCEVIELYTEPDGRFPNHHPDPTVMENIEELRQQVIATGADLGIGWDGDADRIGVVDERGEVIFGDMLLLLYSRQLVKEVATPTIIADVKCSEVLFDELRNLGAVPVMARTGHSLIKAKIKELGAQLAGEMSGHVFFVHGWYGFDDAMHASARLIEILSSTPTSLSQLLADLPTTVSTPELRFDCQDEVKFAVIERAKAAFPEFEIDTLDGVRLRFPHGWGLVRASNTQAALVMRFEADTAGRLGEYRTLVESRIESIYADLSRTA